MHLLKLIHAHRRKYIVPNSTHATAGGCEHTQTCTHASMQTQTCLRIRICARL